MGIRLHLGLHCGNWVQLPTYWMSSLAWHALSRVLEDQRARVRAAACDVELRTKQRGRDQQMWHAHTQQISESLFEIGCSANWHQLGPYSA